MVKYTSCMMNDQEMLELLEQTYLEKAVVRKLEAEKKRRLSFSGAKNFRDLGGYQTQDSRTVRWGLLYRSDCLHRLTNRDIKGLSALGLYRIIDFRADYEKEKEPDRLPAEMKEHLVEIPILDKCARDEFVKNLKHVDSVRYMLETNVELATRFTPEIRQFMNVLLTAHGRPILFHCAAGKDRTGFAAAITLRMLGIPHDIVMEDYLLTNEYFLPAYQWHLFLLRLQKGNRYVETLKGMMVAHPSYLSAGFEAIDRHYGSFENYIYNDLGLQTKDVEYLKSLYLE
jgi:protein-tyrosine phosphatase